MEVDDETYEEIIKVGAPCGYAAQLLGTRCHSNVCGMFEPVIGMGVFCACCAVLVAKAAEFDWMCDVAAAAYLPSCSFLVSRPRRQHGWCQAALLTMLHTHLPRRTAAACPCQRCSVPCPADAKAQHTIPVRARRWRHTHQPPSQVIRGHGISKLAEYTSSSVTCGDRGCCVVQPCAVCDCVCCTPHSHSPFLCSGAVSGGLGGPYMRGVIHWGAM